MKNPYEILGISEDSSENQLQKRYEGLKEKYSEERFLEGEAGNEAARKLMELEDAWALIQADQSRKSASSDFGDFGEIDALIKSGKYSEAQSLMDNISVRTAEWHYYQSIIYYKRDWLSESRTQLAMAVNMDPNNAKYSEALNRLDAVMANPRADQNSFGSNGGPAYGQQNSDIGNSLCRCCTIYCCLDCLCSLFCH